MEMRVVPEAISLVPMIAVFTKYEQFRVDTELKVRNLDTRTASDAVLLKTMVENTFKEQYLAKLTGSPPVVCLESENFVNHLACTMLINFPPAGMHKSSQKCTKLMEKTGNELSSSVVTLMLLAVQKDNLELNINQAVQW
jgi:hypothetical protein